MIRTAVRNPALAEALHEPPVAELRPDHEQTHGNHRASRSPRNIVVCTCHVTREPVT
jgi:hypothetical protein